MTGAEEGKGMAQEGDRSPRREFARGYLDYLSDLMQSLDLASVEAFLQELERARDEGRRVFIVGNGGSAATASHMANDFGALCLKQPGSKPLKAVSLCDNMAFFSAIGNDDGYDMVFVNQLKVLYERGDLLIAISASGNSPNVVKAAEYVRDQGGTTIGLLGFDGGALKGICDVAIVAETGKGQYGPVEDVHLILDHLAAAWLQRSNTD
jgi:D-sedoheptulose 7-phosphate isomerase